MTTLDTKAGTTDPTPTTQSAQEPIVEQSTDTAALITEQQVLFASAAVLAPAPAKPHFWTRAVQAVLTRPEKQPRPPKHYAQRFSYLEHSAMSRAMDRL
jgi:hypothetical protein